MMKLRLLAILFVTAFGLGSAEASADLCAAVFVKPVRTTRELSLERAFYKSIREGARKSFEALRNYRDQTLRTFVNTYVPRTARLDGSFLASFSPQSAEVYDRQQKLTTSLLPKVDLDILRDANDGVIAPINAGTAMETYVDNRKAIFNESLTMRSSHYTLEGKRRSLSALYESFASQGPERQILVDLVKTQDAEESHRTTHFLISNGISPIAHAQILISRKESEPLHIESQWGDAHKIAGQKRGELGRLFFVQAQTVDVALPIPGKSWRKLEEAGPQVRLLLFQKMMSWANHDAGLDSLSLQINSVVLRVLRQMGLPMHLANHHEVQQTLNGKQITEHIFTFDRDGMEKAEDALVKRQMESQLRDFLNHDVEAAQKLILRFPRNEVRAVLSSGLFGTATPRLSYFAQLGTLRPSPHPQHVSILSADFGPRETTADGIFLEHVMAPRQTGSPTTAPFKTIDQLLSRSPDRSGALFEWPSTASPVAQADVVELHFSRAAAQEAIGILAGPR